MPVQLNPVVQVKQPDKIELDQWPTLPILRTYLQAIYAAWHVFTGGADHAEEFAKLAEKMAKGTEKEF